MKQQRQYIFLFAITAFLVVIGWQVSEHLWLRESAQITLKNRAQDISNSLAVVLRSQRRFGSAILQYRLESALEDLVQSDELHSIVLLNSSSDIVAKAGTPQVPINNTLEELGEIWSSDLVAYMNLVDLSVADDDNTDPDQPPMIIIPVTEEESSDFRNRRPPRPPNDNENPRDENFRERPNNDQVDTDRNNDNEGDRERGRGRGFRRGPSLNNPPPGMTREEFAAFIQQQGLHGFIIELSTKNYFQTINRDLWLRFSIMGFAALAVAGIWIAWRNLQKSAELQLRLVRASEMNTHLREMNVAAAGLAHETRNPLNLVRGMAQLINKDSSVSNEVRENSVKITEEVDRVTAQLNEFINYSKPREPKLSVIHLNRVINEVANTLETDFMDNEIGFSLKGDDFYTEADESLLRQLIFNLLLNSVQHVKQNGKIDVKIFRSKNKMITIEFYDNGPGIPQEYHSKVFQPYFTTNEKGTGLGLTVVHQNVLAHGWEIECINNTTGALFQIRGILPVTNKV